MPIEKLRPINIFDEQRLEQLKQIAPECFADGKINWETLKETLGTYTEDDFPDTEHFGLFWPGKREARKLASTPSPGTLVPVLSEGVDEETTRNVFIEGENLDVLKLLQKSYASQIKMVYIDPPYNTGNDFVYDDNFTETIEEYLKRTGQIDEEGRKLTTNSKADGRFHSKWLSMMYPRLRLARNLLKEDGSIFISIDDNEIHNLRQLMNEIFGEENFVAEFIWEKKYTTSNNIEGVSIVHEYILCYVKNCFNLENSISRLAYTQEALDRYKNPDNDPRGNWMDVSYHGPKSPSERPNLVYPIIHPKTGQKIFPKEKSWAYEKSAYESHAKENRLWWGKEFTYKEPRLKKFLSEIRGGLIPKSLLTYKDVGGTSNGRNDLRELFGDKQGAIFDNPKPVSLLKKLISISGAKDEIILDFFSGSGTTGHAVYDLRDEAANLKFILVQIPEKCDKESEAYKAGFKNIAEITKRRIKNASNSLKKKNKKQNFDFGFRVFKLQKSNYINWNDIEDVDIRKLELQFEKFENPLIENWKEEDLLTEVMLIEGFPLDSKIEKDSTHKKNGVQVVSSDFCEHRLLVCLDQKVYAETIKGLHLNDNDIFICLDNAINDEQKVTLSDKGLIKTI